MQLVARSSLMAALVVAACSAPTPAPGATGAGLDAVERNVPYGTITAQGLAAARSSTRLRQVRAASVMPYFAIAHSAAHTSMEDTSMTPSGPAVAGTSVRVVDGDVDIDTGSGTSTSTWLLGGAAVALIALALSMALQPRWRAARAERASRERPRAR